MRFQRSQCRNGSRNFTIVNGVHKIYNMEKKGIKTIHARKDVRLEGNANALVTFQGVLGIRIYLRYTSIVTVPWHIRLRDNTLIL